MPKPHIDQPPICPQCRQPYPPQAPVCPECGAILVDAPRETPRAKPRPPATLIWVLLAIIVLLAAYASRLAYLVFVLHDYTRW